MQILFIPRQNANFENVASFIYLLRSGSKDDLEGQTEIHHLCEHLLFSNLNKSRYPIFTIFRTTMEYTIFQFLFPAKHFIDCLQQVSLLLWNPCITKENFDAQFCIIKHEAEQRQNHYMFDCAFRIAKSYWNIPTTCGAITMPDATKLISCKHQNSDFHLLSYAGPQNRSEVMSVLNQHWPLKQSQNINEKTTIFNKANNDTNICGYFKTSETVTFIITMPGYLYIPDGSYRIITGYLVESMRARMNVLNFHFSYKKLSYPEKSFLIMFFPHNIDEKEIISIVKDVLLSLFLNKDTDKDRMTAFLQAYEFDWIIRCESTADIARELTCSTFRSDEIMSLEKLLSPIRDFDIKTHREMVDKYLSLFTECGKKFEKINVP